MEILVLFSVFGKFLGLPLLVLSILWIGREVFVKHPRRVKWVEAHDGILIGAPEFFEWCEVNGVDPRHYL